MSATDAPSPSAPKRKLDRESATGAAMKLTLARILTVMPHLLASRFLLTREYEKEELGVFYAFLTWAPILGVLFTVALPQAVHYFYPRSDQHRRLTGRLFTMATVQAILGASAFLALAPWLASALEAPILEQLSHLAAIWIAATVFHSLLEPIFIANGRTGTLAGLLIGLGVVNIGVLVAAVTLGWPVETFIHWLLAAELVRTAVAVTGAVLLSGDEEVAAGEEPRPAAKLGTIWAYTLPLGLTGLALILARRLDKILVMSNWPGDLELLAEYTIGAIEIPLVQSVVFAIHATLQPRWVRLHADGDAAGFVALWRQWIGRLALMMLPFTAMLFALGGPFIIFLHGEQYASSVPVFLAYVAIVPMYIFDAAAPLRAMARKRLLFLTAFASLLGNIVLSVLFMRWLNSPLGAALGSVVAIWIFEVGVRLHYAGRELDTSLARILPVAKILRYLVLSAVAGTVTYFASRYLMVEFGVPRLAVLFLGGGIHIVALALIALPTGIVTKAELSAVTAAFRRKKKS